VERIKAGFAAHNRGDIDSLVEVNHPEAVFETLLLEPTMATRPYG
jgi:ketosteroid isomerase-like protein